MARYTIDKRAMHPKDLACMIAEQNVRRKQAQRSEALKYPERVYDVVTRDAGWDHKVMVTQSSNSAIKYDRVTKRWVSNTYEVTHMSNSNSGSDPFSKLLRQVKHDRQRENKQRAGN